MRTAVIVEALLPPELFPAAGSMSCEAVVDVQRIVKVTVPASTTTALKAICQFLTAPLATTGPRMYPEASTLVGSVLI